jgi:hypothetical protein
MCWVKNILAVAFLCFALSVNAQNPLDIQIEIFEPYPVELEYYLENADNLYITVTNLTGIDQEVFYHIRLVGDNGVDIQTLPTVRPMEPVRVPALRTLFYSGNELQRDFPFQYPEDIDLSALSPEQLDYISFNRALPEGNYQLCVTALDWNTQTPLTFQCSPSFYVSYGDVPFIYMPYDGEEVFVSETNHITIGWEPPFTLAPPAGTFQYNLKMIDITDEPIQDIELLLNNPGVFPVLDVEGLMTEIYNYDFPPEIELIEGHQYALRVQAEDVSGNYPLANNGFSEISTFWYGENPENVEEPEGPAENASDCYQNCYYEEEMAESPISNTADLNEFQVGQFTVEQVQWTETNGAAASGSGEISIPFLNDVRVKVNFTSISINAAGRMYDGVVQADVDQVYDPAQMDTDLAQEMNNFIRNGRVVNALAGGAAMGMPLGLVQNVAGYNFMLGFTQMSFFPEQAVCQLMHHLQIPQMGEEVFITMAGTDICLIPAGFGGEYTLHPALDVPVPFGGDLELVFKGSAVSDVEQVQEEACHLEMDCNGLKKLAVRGEVLFPEQTFTPLNEQEGPVKGSFSVELDRAVGASENIYAQFGEEGIPEESGFHFMAQVSVDDFELSALPEWGFALENAWLDCSDFENPSSIQWPESYDDPNISWDEGAQDMLMQPTWQGVYIQDIELTTPVVFFEGGSPAKISGNHMIIDPLLSFSLAVEDIFTSDQGSLDNWSLSMDSLFLTFVQNRLESGGFSGELGIPITAEGQYFRYTALIQDSDLENTSLDAPEYVFSVQPSDQIDFPFMMGKVSLSENSYILANLSPSDQSQNYLELHAEGGVGINSELFETEDGVENIPLSIPLADFRCTYHSRQGFTESHFGFAGLEAVQSSDGGQIEYDHDFGMQFSEESFAGFPLNIESASLQSISGDEVVFNLTPRVSVAGGENGIAGSVGLDFNSTLRDVNGQQKLKLQSVSVSSLSIYSDVYGLLLDGEVEFYNDIGADQVGNSGARGNLQVMLPLGLGVQLAAEFGTQITDPKAAFGTEDHFNYWYVDGMVYFGYAGVPIAPGVGIYGLGGGVFVNMTKGGSGAMDQKDVNTTLEQVNSLSETKGETNAVHPTDGPPSPSFGNYGLKLASTFATHPTPQTLNMDVSVYGEFSEQLGINLLAINGDAFVMTDLSMRNKANIWAAAGLQWEKTVDGQVFDGILDVYVNTPTMYGNPDLNNKMIGAHFHAEQGGSNVWWFHAGQPDQRGELNIDFPFMGSIEASGYLMTGHNVPTELPIPQRVAFLMDNAQTGSGDNRLSESEAVPANGLQRSEGAEMLANMGTGMALGAELEVTVGLDAFIYATMSAFLGFDFNLTQDEARTCFIPGSGDIAPGINDWYGRGQVYAGLEGQIGLQFRFAGKDYNLNLFYMAAAMLLQGGGPNPEWIEGRAGITYSVLNGLVDGTKKFDITVGERCVPAFEDPFAGLEMIYDHYPADGEENVSVWVDPSVTFLLPINEEIILPVLDEEGKTKDMTVELELDRLATQKTEEGASSTVSAEIEWSNDRKNAFLEFDQVLSPFSEYETDVRLIAYEIQASGTRTRLKDENNQNWKEELVFQFTTGEVPYPIPDEEVVRTVPIRNQRFFLQDDNPLGIGQIVFSGNLKDEDPDLGYFPDDNNQYTYNYFARLQDMHGNDPTIIDLNQYKDNNSIDDLVVALPDLEPETIYSFEVVRQTEKNFGERNGILSQIITEKFENQFLDVSATRNINVSSNATRPGNPQYENEDIIYQFYFRTSKFNTLQEKLAVMSIEVEEINSNDPADYYPKVNFYGDEGFDVFDIKGEFDAEGNLVVAPRVNLFAEEHSNHSSNPGIQSYFAFIRQEWEAFDDASAALRNNAHTLSYDLSFTYAGLPQQSTETLRNQTVDDYEADDDIQIDYDQSQITFGLNEYASGFRGPLTEEQIEQQWNNESPGSTGPMGGRVIQSGNPLGQGSGSPTVAEDPVRLSIDHQLCNQGSADAGHLWQWLYYINSARVTLTPDAIVYGTRFPNAVSISVNKWSTYLNEEYPDLMDEMSERAIRDEYFWEAFPGTYHVKIQGNNLYDVGQIPGYKKAFTFEVNP